MMCRVKGTSTVHGVPQSNGRYVRMSGNKKKGMGNQRLPDA